MKSLHNLVGILLIATLALALVSCEQKSSTGSGGGIPTTMIGAVSLNADDPLLYGILGTPVSTDITATVTDTSGNGLPNVLVHFTVTPFGSLSIEADSSDANGEVKVTFSSQGILGAATISATATYGGITVPGSTTILVSALANMASEITLFLAPDTTFQTEVKNDSVQATVYVNDSSGVGIPGLQVRFQTSLGVVAIADTTDNTGRAVTYIQTTEEYGMGVVQASVSRSPTDTASIADVDTFWVLPVDQQITITLELEPQSLYLGSGAVDSIRAAAIVRNADGVGMPGMQVTVSTTLGVVSMADTTDASGTAITYIRSVEDEYGMGLVTASISTTPPDTLDGLSGGGKSRSKSVGLNSFLPDGGQGLDDIYFTSDTDTFWVYPVNEQVDQVIVNSNPGALTVPPGNVLSAIITAVVLDVANNGVQGVPVTFSTDLGSIAGSGSLTNNAGMATATFYTIPNLYGIAKIWATVGAYSDTTLVTVTQPSTATNISIALMPPILYLDAGADDSVRALVRVYDAAGVGISGVQVNMSSTLGVIALPGATDVTGTVSTYIHANQEFGMGLVIASANVPPLIAISDTFWVLPVDQQISELIVSASPSIINVAPDTSGISQVTAIVLDENNNGVAGVPVSFATDLGLLASNSGVTDATGMKTVTYYSIPNQYGNSRVWAVMGEYSDTTEVEIHPTASANGSIQVLTSTNLIYADGGMTYANVTAVLKDADNQVISGANIIFTSNYGTVNSPVVTDSSGQAYAVFTATVGFPSFPDSAIVIGKYVPLNVADTVWVTIMPARLVDHVVLDVTQSSMIANGLDTNRVNATVFLEGNALAEPGTIVNFILGGDAIGEFMSPFAAVGQAGTATVYYKVGTQTGTDSIWAEIDDSLSNPGTVDLIPGPPSHINISADPTVIYINSLEMSTITAEVTDTTWNPVEDNIGVFFTTTLGSISPAQAPTQNGTGVATAHLSASTVAGGAWVKASIGAAVDSILVTFEPSDPAYVNLSAQYSSITVAGIGDTNQTAIYAHIRDASGNYVGNDVMVHFQILNNGFPFGGVNINSHGIEDSTVTNGGIATVVLNAGSNPGPVQIKAWTIGSEGQEISAQSSLVAIVAGPPSYIDINSMSDPDDGGGDTWKVEVSTLVLDAIGNEVPNGQIVFFYLIPNTTAQIQGAATTGNNNWAGDSLNGVAYTTLTYHSDETFDVVTLVAYCMVGADSVIGTQDYQLPLAQGVLSLAVDPIAWNFDHPPYGFTINSPATMNCIAYLTDGHLNPIDNGVIVFFTTRGNFNFYANGSPQYWVSQKITGPGGFAGEPYDSTGYASVYLLTTRDQAFPDPGAIETTGQVHCQVMGYFDVTSDPITVTYTQDADKRGPQGVIGER